MTELAIRSYLEVDDELAHVLWGIFLPAMQRIEKNSPYKQGLREDEFFPMMSDTSFRKYVLYEHDSVVGVAVIATDITKVEWLSVDYFRNVYGDTPIYYMVGVTIKEDYSRASSLGGRALIVAALDDLPYEGTFIYDFSCAIHASLSSFGQMITKDAGRVRMLDAIEYWEIKHSYSQNRNSSNNERRIAD